MVLESGLLGPNGLPFQSYKKATPPKLGEAFGYRWPENNFTYSCFPGGGILQFDLNRLTLADYRLMTTHYQVNASLSVLSFMMHQLDWRIECDNAKIQKHCEDNMHLVWTKLVRALSQAFWAGYSPNVLQWENDIEGRRIILTKVKDLIPEECRVNWKQVDGWAPPEKPKPKLKVYDGIKQYNGTYPIPVENSLWYPLLMENGDYYGRKLLKPAFTSWYFSILIHLFTNRYHERYGEPTVVGRAPYDETIDVNGTKVPGNIMMLNLIQQLRNRSAVVLPNERTSMGNQVDFDYEMEYLESQMRGADFERYLMRLDEEISLAMFTPLLMLRTADVGSYNLGTQHSLVYMQMLNALAGDWAEYINGYILNRMVDFNFGTNAARAVIKFRKLGNDKLAVVTTVLQGILPKDGNTVKPDVKELAEITGLTFTEVEALTTNDTTAKDKTDPNADPKSEDTTGDSNSKSSKSDNNNNSRQVAPYRAVATAIIDRLESQVNKAFRDKTFGNGFVPDLGWQRKLEEAVRASGAPESTVADIHGRLGGWVTDLASAGMNSFTTAGDYMDVVKRGVDNILSEVINATG